MAEETQQQIIRKRQDVEGDEVAEESQNIQKRHKSYNRIISLLADDDEQIDEPETKSTSDLSSFMTSLQQELSDSTATSDATANTGAASPISDEEEKERVFRHLLEASDDELGLPTKAEESVASGENHCSSVESLILDGLNQFGEGNLWEIEDEAANYYALLQSDLFM